MPGVTSVEYPVPGNKCGLIIGKGMFVMITGVTGGCVYCDCCVFLISNVSVDFKGFKKFKQWLQKYL